MNAKKIIKKESIRNKIINAAIEVFAQHGFLGASTREIAKKAGTSQGLLTYHFKTKDDLWFASVDRFFEVMRENIGKDFVAGHIGETWGESIEGLRGFMVYLTKSPFLLQFILEAGKEWNHRTEYLVDNQLRTFYQNFRKRLPTHLQVEMAPHIFYAWLGACTVMFSVPAECKYLTGMDPHTDEAIERHIELISKLFFPHEQI